MDGLVFFFFVHFGFFRIVRRCCFVCYLAHFCHGIRIGDECIFGDSRAVVFAAFGWHARIHYWGYFWSCSSGHGYCYILVVLIRCFVVF